jgi:hypothetical protein
MITYLISLWVVYFIAQYALLFLGYEYLYVLCASICIPPFILNFFVRYQYDWSKPSKPIPVDSADTKLINKNSNVSDS